MIRYALTAGEIAFLSNRLGLDPPVAMAYGLYDEQAAYQCLRQKKLVFGTMDSLSVDMVAAFLIKTLDLCEHAWQLERGAVKALLFQRGRLMLVVSPDPYRQDDGYLLEPTQDNAGVTEALSAAMELGSPDQHHIMARRIEPYAADHTAASGMQVIELNEFIGRLYQPEGDQDGPTFA